MWRSAVALLALSSVALQSVNAIASEGGYVAEPWLYDIEKDARQEEQRPIPEDYEMEEVYRQALKSDPSEAVLESIIQQIQQQQQQQQQYRPQEYDQQYDQPVEIDLQQEPLKADIPVDEIKEEKLAPAPQKAVQVEEAPKESEDVKAEQKPLVAQKKGQSEYVSFVEPVESKQTKSVPSLEKRRLMSSSDATNFYPKYSSSLLTIAVGTVLVVGMVGTIIGGGVYLKRRRDYIDDSDYAPYAGSGPGFGVRGKKPDAQDEKMAYKAQLHHYQQTKQKIICGDAVPAGMDSEGEDEVDDENNFSVYECPGLAPTGDMEVINPNFCANP